MLSNLQAEWQLLGRYQRRRGLVRVVQPSPQVAVHKQLFLTGGENNLNLYVYDVPSGLWLLGPAAIYDGGWGSSLEYVAASQKVYQIDGRNGTSGVQLQGTAALYVGCDRPIANAGPDQSLPGTCGVLTSVTLTGSVTGS